MSRTVILVDHPLGKRDDRASRLLAELGYRIQWCCPGRGEALPEPGTEHAGAVVYGGPESANDEAEKPYIRTELDWIEDWLKSGKPFLGLCLGGQMLAKVLGAPVAPHPDGLVEIGWVPLAPADGDGSFLDGVSHAYQWHREGFELPSGARRLAEGTVFQNQAFRYDRNTYAIQFHPEVSQSVMRRWLREAAHMLDLPNAQPRERQLADAARHDRPMAAWLRQFLENWLSDAT